MVWTDATTLGSTIPGARPLQITMPGVAPAAASSWTPSAPLPTMGAGTLAGPLPTYAITGQTALRFFVQLPAGGVSGPTRLISLKCTGTARTWTLLVNASAQIALRAFEADGTQVLDTGYQTYVTITNGSQCSLGLELTQSGADVNWRVVVIDVTGKTVLANLPLVPFSGTLTAHTVQRVTAVAVGEDGGLGTTTLGHIAIADDTTAYGNTSGALVAWTGETVRSRVARLCAEESVALTAYGTGADLMGPQRIDTLLNLLQQAADIGGTLYEQREAVGLAFRCRDVDYSQAATLALDYTADGEVAPPLTPTDDDQQTRNDITVTRDQGAVARATLDTGPLSTQAPPNGVGRYDSSVTLNLYSDDQPAQHAAWRLVLGTWDGTRYPQVTVDLAAGPHLIDTATQVDIQDRTTIDNTPVWLPPDLVELLTLGYTETLAQYTWQLRYNCGPAGPWNVATLDDATYGRADTEGSQLVAAASSGATSLTVSTTTGPFWTTDPAEMPIPLRVAGEVVTATAIASSVIDTFTRSVSNGWGSTTTGQAWTTTGNAASDFNVTSNAGRQLNTTAGLRRQSTCPAPSADIDVEVNFAASALPATDSNYIYLGARYADVNNNYFTRLQLAPSTNKMTLGIRKRVAATETELTFVVLSGLFAAGTTYWLRFQAIGSTLQAKSWPDGTPEPEWQISATDTSLTSAGSLLVWSMVGASSTNTLPVTFFFDAFEVLNPQTFTVTRSTNGVVKAQSGGADIRLAYPAIAAL
ncbi:hypothetical protein [Peterkaempfera sp. SMS 1(5)a]|uniref:hypothetical protein n=1 Tax=Peterkaempfera podocarpi TaxID=3232308 RepID=UPI003670BE7D